VKGALDQPHALLATQQSGQRPGPVFLDFFDHVINRCNHVCFRLFFKPG
jgi:hypothetical protein